MAAKTKRESPRKRLPIVDAKGKVNNIRKKRICPKSNVGLLRKWQYFF